MSEFKKIPVYLSEHSLDMSVATQESRIEYYQDIINRILALNLGVVFGKNDLTPLLADPMKFLLGQIIKEPLTIGGIELDKDKVFELLKLPKELKNIINSIDTTKNLNDNRFPERLYHHYTKNYFINENNVVEVTPEVLDSLREKHTIYLMSEKQKKAYDALNRIKTALEELKGVKDFPYDDLFVRYLHHSNNGNIEINYSMLHTFL